MGKPKDYTGYRNGWIEAQFPVGTNRRGEMCWFCTCDCGGYVIKPASSIPINKSCGCLTSTRCTIDWTYHGDSDPSAEYHRLFSIWIGMRRRVIPGYNKGAYKNYTDKGITMDPEWFAPKTGYLKFKEWAIPAGYRDDLTIDRIDTLGPYSPDNCRWASIKEQANNKTTNRYIEWNGEIKTLMQWCEEMDATHIYKRIESRLDRGFSIDDAFTRRKGDASSKMYEFNGEKHTMRVWCEILGIGESTVRWRLNKGWSIVDAFTKPARSKRPHK